MTTTAQPSVVEALSRVMGEVRSVGKDGVNSQQGFKFRGIDAVMNKVGPALRAHGVIVVPEVIAHDLVGSQTGNGRPINVCRVKVKYTAYGPAGDSIAGIVPAEAMDSGDKATAKAMSVAYRTFLLQALTLPTDEPDPDEYVYDHAHMNGQQTQQRQGPSRDWLAEAKPYAGNTRALQEIYAAAQQDHAGADVLNEIKKLAPPVEPAPEPAPEPAAREFIDEINDAYPDLTKLNALLTAAKRAKDTAAVKAIEGAIVGAKAEQEAQG